MPELPETETIARDLQDAVHGAVIREVEVMRPDVLRGATARTFTRRIAGTRITHVWRRAKNIVIDVEGLPRAGANRAPGLTHIVVQPRFTGGLLIVDSNTPREETRYSAVKLRLVDGRELHYRDVRRLGTITTMSAEQFAAFQATLGAEPLDPGVSLLSLTKALRSSKRSVKSALMDQRRIAGVGNIYANEALWWACIDPSRNAASLTHEEAGRLIDELRRILRASIKARGTSFRDYRDARGERGSYVKELEAYGREGQPCSRCGHRLAGTHTIDGRSTVFCAWCQK